MGVVPKTFVRCTMGVPRCRLVLIGVQILLSLVPADNALNINPLHLQDAADLNLDANSTHASSCTRFLCVKDGSSSSNGVYPWLINSYNGQTLTYYLHFYDEGLFYNGFWVVNDLGTGYVETSGRVFIYNSENDFCPEATYNYWYFWQNGEWVYNTGIYLQNC